MKLLTNAASNSKTAKLGEAYEAVIMHLAPAKLADGKHTVCPWSTAGCRAACLNTSGRSQVTGDVTTDNLRRYDIHNARIERTLLYLGDRDYFIRMLSRELGNLQKRADSKGKIAVARLNGTSDIPWETVAPELFDAYPRIVFYDYTKSQKRAAAFAKGNFPSNYHLTYSRNERDDAFHIGPVRVNVAVVFAGELPARYMGRPVIDGTLHDWRFTDPEYSVVGLTAKARAKHDETGFVVNLLPGETRLEVAA